MCTRSSSNLPVESSPNPTSSNPERRNNRCSKQPFILEESPVDTMADQRTMAELLRAPIEGYAETIVVPLIPAEQFELKHSLINMMTSDQFSELEKDNPHDHIRWFNKITSTIKYKDVPNSAIKLMLFPFSLAEAAHRWLEKEPPRSILTWDDLVSKFINEFFPPSKTINIHNEISNFQQHFDESFHEAWDRYKDLLRACPHHGFIELYQLDTFYNALNPTDQDSLNSTAGGNLLERRSRHLPSNTIANSKGELKAITTQSGIVLDGPSVPIPPPFINPQEDERVEETLTDQDLAEYTIKVPPPVVQKPKPPFQRNFVVYQRDPLHPNIPYPSRMHKEKQQEKDEVQIHKFWQMFNELKCKVLADLGASINLIPLSVWKKLGLPELIFTRMTLELANRSIFTPAKIARDVFVSVGKFTFPADFVIVDYESDPKVPLILGRPFLRTARALIDVHGEEMILRDGDKILTLNMRHDTSSYSNQPQKESINMINIYDDSSEGFLENLFATNHQSGNPTFSSHPDTTSSSSNHLLEEFVDELALITFPPGNDDLPFDIESDLKEIEYLLNHDPIKDRDSILEDSVDEDNLADLNDNLVDTMPKMFTEEHALDYSSPPLYDEYDDDLFEVKSNTEYAYDDPFDSMGEKIKEFKLLIDELDLHRVKSSQLTSMSSVSILSHV
nr:reverse transcriptase domain-containing protein [Tanacetum cinerariifolium]